MCRSKALRKATRRQADALRREEQALRADLATLDRAEAATRDFAQTRSTLAAATTRVYADPERALRALVADPGAVQRLAADQAAAYGRLQGRTRILGRPDRARAAAAAAVPELAGALRAHVRAAESAERRIAAAVHVPANRRDLELRLARTTSTLAQLQRAARGPERALAAALRDLGERATQTALALVPAVLKSAVRLALRAIERERGLGLDR
jgi:hypothetical protein